MSESAQFKFQWQLNWKILVFSLIFFPVTVQLGFWQLDRAEEKSSILTMYNARRQMDAEPFANIVHQGDRQYLRVKLAYQAGDFPTLLLDNRVQQGKPGYEVLDIVKTDVGQLMVNRGWVQASLNRQQLPEISPLQRSGELSGYLYQSPGKQIMLGEDDWNAGQPMVVVQNGAPDVVGSKLNVELYPYQLRLDEQYTNLSATWQVVNVQPAKHTGYAVQWFAMSIALVLLTLFANSNLGSWFSRKKKLSNVEKGNE